MSKVLVLPIGGHDIAFIHPLAFPIVELCFENAARNPARDLQTKFDDMDMKENTSRPSARRP
jgi:hypothetical protein